MLNKIALHIKRNPAQFILGVLSALLFVMFTFLFSFYVLQSDDFYYSTFLKNGIGRFFELSVNHYQKYNGRALVHFFAQLTLSLPHVLGAFVNSVIVFFIGFLSLRLIKPHYNKKQLFSFTAVFYALLCLIGSNIFKEGIMWVSAFYNYVFPLLVFLIALNLSPGKASYVFFFLAGATTEQWGVCAIAMLIILKSPAFFAKGTPKAIINAFLPILCTVAGYMTIYLSPATGLRITETGHTSLPVMLSDLPRLSLVFLQSKSAVPVFLCFTILMLFTAFLLKGRFNVLFSGFLVLFLLVTLPLHKSYLATFLLFVVFLITCAFVFYLEKHTLNAAFITSALASALVMLPTNTFEARIATPCVLLIILSVLCTAFTLYSHVQKKLLYWTFGCFVTLCVMVFIPVFSGFMHNSFIEQENLRAIEKAQKTNTLVYNIDYDKNFATKQMFNDGWMYKHFISLYSLENCDVVINSKNAVKLDCYDVTALTYKGEVYVPMRAFLKKAGGTITAEGDVIMTFNSNTLTMSDGMLFYHDASGNPCHKTADKNRLPDFYTLYIKLDVVNEAFHTQIKAL